MIVSRLRSACLYLLPIVAILGGNAAAAFAAVPNNAAKTPVARTASHKLQPMDLIKIQFFQEQELDRDLRVSQDHKIVLPLIGPVDVKDRSVREVEILVANLFRGDYLVNPQVNVTVLEYSQRTVAVLGAVNTPGPVVLPPEKQFTLLDAIARSGGFSRLANRKLVSLTRTLPDGRTTNHTINTDHMVAGDSADQWIVKEGDIVFIPERLL